MGTGEVVWDALPEAEQKAVWDETERNFWINFRSKKEAENNEIEKNFQISVNEVRLKLSGLRGQRSQLKESQYRLAKELAKVEAELARTTDECEEKAARLERMEQDYHMSRQNREDAQQDVWVKMRRFFRQKRGEDPDAPDNRGPESEGIVLPELLPELSASNGVIERREPTNGTASIADRPDEADDEDRMEGIEHHDNEATETLVNAVDADGNVIGPVEHIEPWNQWVEGIQELEIRRPVKIRRGRRFNASHLATIYERSEAKGVKWLSCMIQATGEIQAKRCQSCDKNQGAFDDCIIVGGDLYQKCGNCEWNRQGCHGASGDTIDILASRERARRKKQAEKAAAAAETPADRSSEAVHPTVEVQPRPEPARQLDPPQAQRVEEQISVPSRPHPPQPVLPRTLERLPDRQPERQPEGQFELQPERRSERVRERQPELPMGRQPERRPGSPPERVAVRPNERFHDVIYARAPERTVEVAPVQVAEHSHEMTTPQEYKVTPGFTPANVRSRPPLSERGRPTSPSLPIDPLSQPPESPPAPPPVEEIMAENMVLKNNGEVYTYPECVEGVPLVKITEEHPYWEANWPNVRTLIEPQLARWREKHQAAIEAGPKQKKGDSSKYLIGRQVNRGVKILEFHEKGPISPYQLLGKRYIQAGKGCVTSYNTIFRLSETMSELEKFNLDISPVDWMRHRLHELIQSQGADFNLPRTIHGFYHDSKLTSLRYKHGFKNIGRPSGALKARLGHGSLSNTPKPLQKRKSIHSVHNTPREDSFINQSPLPSHMPPIHQAHVPSHGHQPATDTWPGKRSKV
ncbi:hypothetical protein FOXYSP1_19576 [Fusarium oxysporum f. sp. phaseoli]